jgi:hypothetical protein
LNRVDADAVVHLLLSEWVKNADPELQDKWRKITPFTWKVDEGVFKCTLNWTQWDLSIVTFDVPETIKGIDVNAILNSQHILLVEGLLHENGNPIIVHAQVAQTKYPGQPTVTMPVVELCDSFLAGEWTPWWTCRCCHMRKQMRIKPE